MSKMTDKLGGAMRASLGVGTPAAAEAQAPPSAGSNLYGGTRALSDGRIISVDRIVGDPDQPRREFEPEKLAELGLSLKRRGRLQPIRVREDKGNDRFVIVAGERRWRAARIDGNPHPGLHRGKAADDRWREADAPAGRELRSGGFEADRAAARFQAADGAGGMDGGTGSQLSPQNVGRATPGRRAASSRVYSIWHGSWGQERPVFRRDPRARIPRHPIWHTAGG